MRTKVMKKIVGLVVCASLLALPCQVSAMGGEYDYDAANALYLAGSGRTAITAETRPEYPVMNSAIDNAYIRDHGTARFVETDEKHFLTLNSTNDEWAVFGHEESLGIKPGGIYDIETYIRNDATLCTDGHLPSECSKTLKGVRVRAAFPNELYKGQFGCIVIEIISENGTPTVVADYIEVLGSENVHLSLVPNSIVIQTDGLTNGTQLNFEEFFSEKGAAVGYYSLDSGIPAGYAIKVKFQIQT